jgi:hypothetical protein
LHQEFVHIRDWLFRNKGVLVYGGKVYKEQLGRVSSVFGVLAELKKSNQVKLVPDEDVDAAAAYAKTICQSNDFDDEFLVGIVSVSGAKVVCLNDPRSHKYLKRKDLYINGVKAPKIYTGVRTKNLLSSKYHR